jgi:hypothetical protein
MWVWARWERQLFHQIRVCQVVAAATVDDDMNRSFMYNAFGVEQGVVLVLLWLGNLHAECTSCNKTLILVSVHGRHTRVLHWILQRHLQAYHVWFC